MADLKRLLSRSGLIMMMRLMGAAITLGMQITIARLFGRAMLGEYMVALAIVNLTAMVLPLGFQTVSAYFTAEYRARGQGQNLRQFLRQAYAQTFVSALLFLVGGTLVLRTYGDSLLWLRALWLPISVLALSVAAVFLSGSVLAALKHSIAGFVADTLIRPLAMAAGLLIALSIAPGDSALAYLFGSAALIYGAAAILHFAYAKVQAQTISTSGLATPGEASRWWRYAVPWSIIAIATDFFFDVDLLLLGPMAGKDEIAVFGVATRIFLLAAFGIAAIYAIYLPDIFEATASNRKSEISNRIASANTASLAAAVMAVPVIYFASPLILQVFGKAFIGGSMALAILSLSLVVRAAFGPAALVLTLHDHPYASLPAIVVGFATLILGNWLLVPQWGITGAAVAADIAIFVWSAIQWRTAVVLTGTDVSVFAPWLQRRRSRAKTQNLIRPDKPTDT